MKTNKKCPRYGMSAIGENPISPTMAGPSESAASTSDAPIIKMERNRILIRSKSIAEK
jgi:hypothetical protein